MICVNACEIGVYNSMGICVNMCCSCFIAFRRLCALICDDNHSHVSRRVVAKQLSTLTLRRSRPCDSVCERVRVSTVKRKRSRSRPMSVSLNVCEVSNTRICNHKSTFSPAFLRKISSTAYPLPTSPIMLYV